ncbi:KPN_02809 family neutral zinc metallopeptidase [Taibaiella soli]|uniref:Metalloprotease n=1 Tax=Taibaiella soli TaxID=1649169 RepID=A0A2W2BDP1_9BACT|nr:neutral zinc metallopeptidase [Taibaiella soli]PZF73997.1 metalloprotease [Taibaiella soli]
MRWRGERESENVEDRRGIGGGKIIGGGIGAIIIAVIVYFLGGNPNSVLQSAQQSAPVSHTMPVAADDSLKEFSAVVLGYTEDVWTKLFAEQNMQYKKPTLVLFTGSVQSGCGGASAATGPFYCPLDQKVYLDLSFFQELRDRFRAPGNFAMAYVIAHEVGHHVQKLLGISDKVHALQQRTNEAGANKLSVKLELQADFFAGVWAHHAQEMKDILDPGDIEAALAAANAIGDDRLQQEAQGYVVPDAFTHGTSAQRMYWFKKGFDTGDMAKGDTFADNTLN